MKILDFGLVRDVNSDTHLPEAGMVMGRPRTCRRSRSAARPRSPHRPLQLPGACSTRFGGEQREALGRRRTGPRAEAQPEIPKSLSDLIADLLAKDPVDRPRSSTRSDRTFAKTARARGRGGRSALQRSRLWYAVAAVAVIWLVAAGLVALAPLRPRRSSWWKNAAVVPLSAALAVEYLRDLSKSDEKKFPPPDVPAPPGVDGTVRVRSVPSPHGIFMHGALVLIRRPSSLTRWTGNTAASRRTSR